MKTFNLLKISAFVALLISFSACTSKTGKNELRPAAPDYAETGMWWKLDSMLLDTSKSVDVFYIISTCSFDWKDSSGQVIHYMDIYDSAQCAYMNPYLNEGYELFSPSCRFFAPYYRQLSFESWSESADEINRRYAFAHEDVSKAFRYYMDHFNQGRPFVLAGHSQGAKAVIELLKHDVTEEEYARMVAAYVFGYEITAEELENYPMLRPVSGADDRGVICFNSVSNSSAASALFKHNVVCINPLTWSYDTTYAPAALNLGSVFRRPGLCDTFYTVGARLNAETHLLEIDGLSDEDFFAPKIQNLFPKGNYHIYEQNLYYLNVQQNLTQRIAAYTLMH